MPKISVLVPIYNVERFLHECLDSVVQQTLKDIEIICINDGSTDSSLSIINEYAAFDSRIVVIDKPNSGYGDSMNRGLAAATGEYIGIVESDDWAEPDMFEKLYTLATKNAADVAKSNFYSHYTDPKKRRLTNKIVRLVHPEQVGRLIDVAAEPHILFERPAIWSGIYRRDFLEANDIKFLPTPGASYQDTGFGFKVWATARRVIFTDDAYLHYRMDNEASSVTSPGKAMCVSDEYSSIETYLREHSLFEKFKPFFYIAKWGAYDWNIERLAADVAGPFIEQASLEFRNAWESGSLDLGIADANQRRGIFELIETPDMVKQRRAAQDRAKATVIVPVHNSEKYIAQCVDSILEQTVPEVDLIVVDDGSVDGSVEILEEHFRTEPRLRLFTQENRGQGAARNIGLERACADVIMFSDSDDFFEPDAVERLVEALEDNGVDLTVGSIRPAYEKGSRTAAGRAIDESYYRVRMSGTFEMTSDLLEKTDASVCNKAFRRELVENLGLRFPDDLRYEDAYFVSAYGINTQKAVYLNPEEHVYNYRRHVGSTMNLTFTGAARGEDHMDIAFRLLEWLDTGELKERFGQYYLWFLRTSMHFAAANSPWYTHRELWRRAGEFIAWNWKELSELDSSGLERLIASMPAENAREVRRVRTLPGKIMRKVRHRAKDAMWRFIPSYRAASTVMRRIDELSWKIDVLANRIDNDK
ncbi:glycosyltransferase [Scrofimicrobium canadense]|uniref:glycosyltransferase n=1 Tax=Scrofimicrobium canadense TaxID=2652290 RepID=UPI00198110BF|nr:glycosyltransferase family 2 protein [Scrofimicrobium canadense]